MLGFQFNNPMKIIKSIVLLVVALAASRAQGEIEVLDFSSGEHSFAVFESAGIELEQFNGIPYLRTLSSGIYRVILPGGVTLILDIDRGEVRSELEKEGDATTIKLFTKKLSLEASKKLAYSFHSRFHLSTDQLDKWFVELENGEAYSAYSGGGLDYNFPFLAMSLRTSFDKAQPAFAVFSISWDEKFSKRSGRTLSNNKELNVSYDMPELLEGVPEFTEVPEVEPVIVKVNDSQPFVAETPKPGPAIKEPTEIKTPEQTDEPAETSPNWWLWLIGAVIVVAGISLAARRKN